MQEQLPAPDTGNDIGNRQNKRTAVREQRIVEATRLGTTFQAAASYAGISLRTLERWLRDDPELRERVARAREAKAIDCFVPSIRRPRVPSGEQRFRFADLVPRDLFSAKPVRHRRQPRYRPKEMRVLTIEEARAFVNALADDEYAVLWLVLISTGLRLGEALGVERQDVDFERAMIAVRQSVTEVNGVARVSALKTHSSRRPVQIGPQISARAGIAALTIHGLRHTMTSLGIAGGIQIKVPRARDGSPDAGPLRACAALAPGGGGRDPRRPALWGDRL